MNNTNEVQNKVETEARILNRQLATELSLEDLQKVSGGSQSARKVGGTSYCGCNCEPDDCLV